MVRCATGDCPHVGRDADVPTARRANVAAARAARLACFAAAHRIRRRSVRNGGIGPPVGTRTVGGAPRILRAVRTPDAFPVVLESTCQPLPTDSHPPPHRRT